MAEKTNWVVLLLACAVVYLFATSGANNAGTQTNTGTVPPYISTGANTLTFAAADALQSGTAVTANVRTSVNGAIFSAASGTMTLDVAPGDKIEILANATGYHTIYVPAVTANQAPAQTVAINMKAAQAPSIKVFNDVNAEITGTVNQTLADGGSANMKIRFYGTDKKATGPQRCVIDFINGTSISTASLSGLPGVKLIGSAKPASITASGVNSKFFVYDIDSIDNAVTPEGNVNVVLNTGKSVHRGYMKITCESKSWFIDGTSGKAVQDIEDSAGTAKNETYVSGTYYFQSS